MVKILEVPIEGALLNGDIAVIGTDRFVGSTDMAYSLAVAARKAGKRVALLTTVDIGYLGHWEDDPDPDVRIHDNLPVIFDGMVVIVVSNGSITREALDIPGAASVIGVSSASTRQTMDSFRLEQSDRMLLDELEKLLPPDSQVRRLRDELRRRIYK